MDNNAPLNKILQPPINDGMVRLVYILYLVGLFVGGTTSIIGVVIAYIYQDDAPDWLKSHYQFQIRTFWIGLLWVVLGAVLSVILIGFLIWFFGVVWLIIRAVKGFRYVDKKEAYPDVQTWLF